MAHVIRNGIMGGEMSTGTAAADGRGDILIDFLWVFDRVPQLIINFDFRPKFPTKMSLTSISFCCFISASLSFDDMPTFSIK